MNVEQMIQIVLVVLGIYFLYTIFITKKNTFFGGNNTEEETTNVNNVNSVNVNSINENELNELNEDNELNELNEINMNNIENENNVQGLDENELYEIENNNNILENNNDGSDCLNKNKLLPEDLLPKDVDGNLENGNENGNTINYLDAGRHIGINTVGQTLKNANRQIRSEPANPRQEVSPWNQSTIEHDNYRVEFELNESKVE
jgi:hypothetical protein